MHAKMSAQFLAHSKFLIKVNKHNYRYLVRIQVPPFTALLSPL